MHPTLRALLTFLALLAGCVPKEQPSPAPPLTTDTRLLIVCEGSLGNGNASLDLYLPAADSFYPDIYRMVNGNALGDVFQSMTRIGDQYLLCVNNSDKIITLNRRDFLTAGVINIPKPRYILPLRDGRAYVSTLFSNRLFEINPRTGSVTDTISLPANNPEGVLMHNGKVYVAAWDTAATRIYSIDTATNRVIDSVAIAGRAPQELGLDHNNKLWVLAGNVSKGVAATLTVLDVQTKQIIRSFLFPSMAEPIRLVWNNARDTIYYIGVRYDGSAAYNGVFRMAADATELPTQPFIPAQSLQYFWALGVDPVSGNILVGDPRGFVQRGIVRTYDRQGVLLRSWITGVGPGHFLFDYP